MFGLDALQRMVVTPWMYDRVPEIHGNSRKFSEVFLSDPRDPVPSHDMTERIELPGGKAEARTEQETKDLARFLKQEYTCAYCGVGGLKPGIICPGCGPHAMIRYCSTECMLADTTHQANVCSETDRVELFSPPVPRQELPSTYRNLVPAIPLPLNATKALVRQRAFISALTNSSARLYPLVAAHQKIHKNCTVELRHQKKLTRADWVVFEETPTCGSFTNVMFAVAFPDHDRQGVYFRRLRNAAMHTQDPALVDVLARWILDMIYSDAAGEDRYKWGEIFVEQSRREFASCAFILKKVATPAFLESLERHPFIAAYEWDSVEKTVVAVESVEPLLFLASKGEGLSEDERQLGWHRAGPGWTGKKEGYGSGPDGEKQYRYAI